MKDYLNIRDSYKLYKASNTNPVSISTYVSIVNGFMKFLIKKLLNKGEIRLPERMGYIHIQGKEVNVRIEDGKIKGLSPDWAGTKKLWEENPEAKEKKQLVYHFNEETNGVRYKYNWKKSKVLVPNRSLYQLRMTRTNKRDLSALIKKGKEYQITE